MMNCTSFQFIISSQETLYYLSVCF